MASPLIVHYHLFKNAGSTIDAILRDSLGKDWHPFESEDPEGILTGEDLCAYLLRLPLDKLPKAVSSHQLRPPLPGIPCFPIVVLRHPVDRIISIWHQWRKEGRLKHLKSDRPDEFFEWLYSPGNFDALMARNGQTLFLANAVSQRTAAKILQQGILESDFAQAESFIGALPIVGLVDQLPESLAAWEFHAPPGCGVQWQYRVENTSRPVSHAIESRLAEIEGEIGSRRFNALLEENEYDLKLYELGKRKLQSFSPTAASRWQISGRPTSEAPAQATGERFIPGDALFGADTALEHVLRYQFFAPQLKGLNVLDAACGEGYGADILARHGAMVQGLDLDRQAIAKAEARYGRENCRFVCGSIGEIPVPDHSFDVVISFETIEHVGFELQKQFISEVRRVLKPGGRFIVSTPDRENYNKTAGSANPWHVREMDRGEFAEILADFSHVEWFHQGILALESIWPDAAERLRVEGPIQAHDRDATFLIAVCRDHDPGLSTEPSTGVVAYDRSLSHAALRDVLQEKERHIQDVSQWAQRLDGELAKNQLLLKSAKSKTEFLENEAQRLDVQAAERSNWAIALDKELSLCRCEVERLRGEFEERSAWALKLDAQLHTADELVQRLTIEQQHNERVLIPLHERISALSIQVEERTAWAQERDQSLARAEGALAALRQDVESRDRQIQEVLALADTRAQEVEERSRWAQDRDAEVQRLSAEVSRLQAESAARTAWALERDQALARAEGALAALRQDVESRDRKIQEILALADTRAQEVEERTRWAQDRDAEVQKLSVEVSRLQAESAARTAWALERDQALARAEGALAALRQDVESRDRKIQEILALADTRAQEVEERTRWAQDRDAEVQRLSAEVSRLQAESAARTAWALERDQALTRAESMLVALRLDVESRDRQLGEMLALANARALEIEDRTRWALDRNAEVQKLSSEVERVQAESAARTAWALERDAELRISEEQWLARYRLQQQELERLEGQLREKEKEITERTSWAKERDAEVARQSGEIERLQQESQDRTAWAMDRDRELRESIARNVVIQAELEERLVWVQRMQALADEQAQTIESRTRWAQQGDVEIQRLSEVIKELQAQVEERTQWATNLDRELKTASAHVLASEGAIADRDKMLLDLHQHVEILEKKLQDRTAWAQACDNEISRLGGVITGLQIDYEERTRWALKMVHEIAEYESRLGDLNLVIKKYLAERLQLEAEQQKAKTSLHTLRQLFADKSDFFQPQSKTFLEEIAAIGRSIKSVQADRLDLSRECGNLAQRLLDAERMIQEKSGTISVVTKQLQLEYEQRMAAEQQIEGTWGPIRRLFIPPKRTTANRTDV